MKFIKEFWAVYTICQKLKKVRKQIGEINSDCALRGKPLPDKYYLLQTHQDVLICRLLQSLD